MHLAPLDIQVVGPHFAIRWSDGVESYLELEPLRRACPCAGCQGEPDIDGYVARPHVAYDPARSFQLRAYIYVGGYAVQPTWEDGHNTGIYSFDYLRRLGRAAEPAPIA